MFDIIVIIVVEILCVLAIVRGIFLSRTHNTTRFTLSVFLIAIAIIIGIIFPSSFINRCPNCCSLFANDWESNYCCICGAKFKYLRGKCPSCGAEDEYGKFCGQCGKEAILLED